MPTPAAPPSFLARLQLALRPPARRIGLALLVLVLGLYLTGNRLLDSIELKTYDLRLLAHPATESSTSVAIVAIDEQSLAAIGRWPWSRSVLAQLIDRLDAAGARVIALDAFFSEPENRAALEQIDRLEHEHRLNAATSPYRGIRQALATDATLAATLGRSGKVVLPIAFLLSPEEARHQRPGEFAQQLAGLEPYAVKIIHDSGDGRLDFPMPATFGVVTNLPELTRAARAIGHINIVPDSDGVIRWAQLIMAHDGAFFPSADLQAARLYQGMPALTLHTAYGIRGVQLGERWIPTNEHGRALVHYRSGARHFPVYSATDVLAGRIDGAALRDRIVLIGPTAAGLGDVRPTPIDSLLPGVEIRATTIQNLLDGDFIQRPGWMTLVDLAVIAGLGLLLAILLPRLRFRGGVGAPRQ
jgi:CHASE2 domain-containing sensor protein